MGSEGKSSSIGTPLPDIEIDAALVYRLLEEQDPDLAHLPIHLVETGWDNAMFRLGEQFSVRLPRRKAAATLIDSLQTRQASSRLSLAMERITVASGCSGGPRGTRCPSGKTLCVLLAFAA
jgi:hypothetical protein